MDDSTKKASFFNPKNPLTPTFIPLIFWLGLIVCVVMAAGCFVSLGLFRKPTDKSMIDNFPDMSFPVMSYLKIGLIARAIGYLTLGPLFWFVICELIAGFFHITKNIETIRQTKTQ